MWAPAAATTFPSLVPGFNGNGGGARAPALSFVCEGEGCILAPTNLCKLEAEEWIRELLVVNQDQTM